MQIHDFYAFRKSSYFVPAEEPDYPVDTTLNLYTAETTSEGIKRFEFLVTGRTFAVDLNSRILSIHFVAPDHMVMAISPLPGYKLIDWSLLDFVPSNVQIWNSNVGDRPIYFVQSAFGSGLMEFTLDIQVKDGALCHLN